jgi:hypothetical protein
MNLHLFHSNNFIKETQHVLRKHADENIYIVVDKGVNNKIENVIYLKKEDTIRYIVNNKPKRIIIHYLDAKKINIILKSKFCGVIHWSSWGADLYMPYFKFNYLKLFDIDTYAFLKKNKLTRNINIMVRTPNYFRPLLLLIYRVVKRKKHDYQIIESFIPKIDTCSFVIPTEYEFVNNNLFKMKYIPLVYGDLEFLLSDFIKNNTFEALGDKIIVGNSGTPSNNHPTVYNKLKNKYKIVSPITYGDEKYIDKLKNEYKNSPIEFIEKHLALTDYVKFLKSCNTMIINTHRQQAVGNVIMGIYLGMRVYLNTKNKLYYFLKSLDVNVYDFETDFDIYKNEPLNSKQIKKNRNNIKKYWSKENVDLLINDFMKIN